MREKLSNVQALRGVACLSVLLAHAGGLGNVARFLPTYGSLKWLVVGVDIFFVLSGFLMYEITREHWGDVRRFVRHRAQRIYPMYWLASLDLMAGRGPLSLLLGWISGEPIPDGLYRAASLLLLPAIEPMSGELRPPLEVGWTLTYEVFFYALFAVLMLGPRRFLPAKVTGALLACLAVGFAFPREHLVHHFLGNPILLEFAFGCWVAWGMGRMPAMARRRAALIAGGLIAAGFLWLLAPVGLHPLTRAFRLGVPAVLFVAGGLLLERAGFLAPKLLQRAGDGSYSIYLFHGLMLLPIAKALHAWLGVGGLSGLALAVAVTALAGWVIYFAIERPLMRVFKRLEAVREVATERKKAPRPKPGREVRPEPGGDILGQPVGSSDGAAGGDCRASSVWRIRMVMALRTPSA